MTPDEIKNIALQSSKEEYEEIMAAMKQAAEEGSFSCSFRNISDGAISQLNEAGFNVLRKNSYNRSALGSRSVPYYEVSVK